MVKTDMVEDYPDMVEDYPGLVSLAGKTFEWEDELDRVYLRIEAEEILKELSLYRTREIDEEEGRGL